MNRLALILLLLFTSAPLRLCASPPNVLLILADDLGFSDLGCYGSEIQTPNLDAIAEHGLRFTQFYNTARCWPTRGSLMTGYYAQQIRRDTLPGVTSGGGNRSSRPDWAVLLPKLLAPAGYRSYHTGKWHIDGMPLANGFDHSYYLKDQGRFFNPTKHHKDDQPLPPVKKGTDFYATTALADHVIEVLEDHTANHKDKAFFHYLAFAAPHFPLHALPEDIALYDDVYQKGWDVIRQQRWQRQRKMGLLDKTMVNQLSRVERDLGPPYHFPEAFEILGPGEVDKPLPWKDLTGEQKKFQAKKMAIHAAMIHRMDIEIGRVFDQIKKMGQWENTLVLFLSDNGASAEIMVRDDGHDPNLPPGSAGTYLCLGPGWSTVSNTPFRRHKTWTHEGGTATPFIASWPRGITAQSEIRRNPGHVIDVVPTLLELAGARTLPEAPPAPGKSLVPVFTADNSVDRKSIWWFHDGHKAIRMGNWKAVAPIGEPWELYDLSNDRDESSDRAIAHPEKLQTLVAQWESELLDFIETATGDLSPEVLKTAQATARNPNPKMREAQDLARPKREQVLLGGKSYLLNGRHAFLMAPEKPASAKDGKPWIFYGPTLKKYPDEAESWMHQQFLDAGIAVAGIDVGEAHGSPHAFPFFEALYQKMVADGYSKKPALLGRSRGGLWVSSWALEHPDRVAGIGGIYPVYDFTTYPKIERAASAYGMTPEELLARQDQLNPIKRGKELAKARIPVCIIHGDNDTVVPHTANSAALRKIYQQNGAGDLFELIIAKDQGHSFWEGYFHNQRLVDFLIAKARGEDHSAAATPAALPLVILMGDSIRMGYQGAVREELAGKAEVWSPKENGAHTVHTLANLEKWLTTAGRAPDIIHINVGLHDMYLNATTGKPRHTLAVYDENLRAIFTRLRELTDAEIVFALTTAVHEDWQAKSKGYGRVVRRNTDIDRYNARARKIAKEFKITVNDLNAFVKKTGPDKILRPTDGVHFTPHGSELLGATVADSIQKELPE